MNIAITLRVMSFLGSHIANLFGGISQNFAIVVFLNNVPTAFAQRSALVGSSRRSVMATLGGASHDVH
jgi:hypothetical protein